MKRRVDEAAAVHAVATRLKTHDWRFDARDLPANGVYVMFERGEEIETPDGPLPRIVRVASHRKAGRLVEQVKANFGSPYSGPRSHLPPLRCHYRRALLRSLGLDPGGQCSDPRFEERVIAEIRERFTFAVIPLQDADERSEMERALIALLAQHPAGTPSKGWLGRFAGEPIAGSGLWNAKHLGARPLDAGQLARLESMVGDAARADAGPARVLSVFPDGRSLGVASPLQPSALSESGRMAESLFLGGLTWLRATYQEHDFVTRRDIVWTLHKRLATVARRTRSGLEIHSALRNPLERSRQLDLAVADRAGRLLLLANVLYEPDRARRDADLRYALLPYTSWDEVRHAAAAARRLVSGGVAEAAWTVLIDEGGAYTAHRLPEACREEWRVARHPSLTVTYVAARGR